MDLLSVFAAGAIVYTGMNFLPAGKRNTDDLILDCWEHLGVKTKDGLLPEKKKGCLVPSVRIKPC